MVQGIDATYSLLDEQKQRRANEAARRERKNEVQDNITKLLVEGGLYLGNAVLADKTQDFINSTEQRGLRQMANAADANIAFLETEATKMQEYKGDRLHYMMDQVTPLVTAEFNAETEDYREGQDPYNYALQNRIREVAQERLRLFEEAEAIYKDKDMNNFGDRLDVLQNKYTDSSLTEFAVSAVRNIGKSKEDLEMEEILAFKDFVDQQTEGTRGYYAAQLQDLVTAYNRTGDLALSSRFAKEANVDTVLGDPTKEERFAYKTTIKFQEYGPSNNRKLFVVKQQQRMDRSVLGPDKKPFWEDVGEADISLYSDDPEFGLTEQEYVQGVYDSVGFSDLVSKYKIDKQKLDEYHTRLQDNGLSLIPRNKEELATYLQITTQFLTENTSYFTEGQEEVQKGLIQAALAKGADVDKLISEMSRPVGELEKVVEQKIRDGELDQGTTVEMYRNMLSQQAAQLSAQIAQGVMTASRQIRIPQSEVIEANVPNS